MFQKIKKYIKKSYKIQYITAICTLWTFGLISCIYLLSSFNRSPGTNTFPLNPVVNKQGTASSNDAYVFININKKRLLTKYIATYSSFSTSSNNTTRPNNVKSNVEKILKKPNFRKETKPTDFSIKAAPKI